MIQVDTENDIERLRAFARCADRENQLLRRRISNLITRLANAEGIEQQELLTQELATLNEQLGEQSSNNPLSGNSERRRPDAPTSKKKTQTGHGPTEQPRLEVVEEILTLDEPDQICPKCGGSLLEIEGQFEASELVDVVDVECAWSRSTPYSTP